LPIRRAFVKQRVCAGCVCLFFILNCAFALRIFAVGLPAPPNSNEIHIPIGVAVAVDGVKSAGEWDDAAMTQFAVAPGWNVRVFAKHDAQYIYFDFEGVTHPGSRLFPEILVDPRNTKSLEWQKGSGGCTFRIICAKGMARRTFMRGRASPCARIASQAGKQIIRRMRAPRSSK
jgi:hypothetical protein